MIGSNRPPAPLPLWSNTGPTPRPLAGYEAHKDPLQGPKRRTFKTLPELAKAVQQLRTRDSNRDLLYRTLAHEITQLRQIVDRLHKRLQTVEDRQSGPQAAAVDN